MTSTRSRGSTSSWRSGRTSVRPWYHPPGGPCQRPRRTVPGWPRRILPPSMQTHERRSISATATRSDRHELLNRLKRIEGQVRGIRRLVEEEAYCLDVLQQVEAMTAAADQVGCSSSRTTSTAACPRHRQTGEGEAYVDEVMAVVRRAMGRRAGARQGAARPDGPAGRCHAVHGSAAGGNRGTPAASVARGIRAGLLPEHRELLAAALDERIEPIIGSSPRACRLARDERLEMLPLEEVPVLALHLVPQPREIAPA